VETVSTSPPPSPPCPWFFCFFFFFPRSPGPKVLQNTGSFPGPFLVYSTPLPLSLEPDFFLSINQSFFSPPSTVHHKNIPPEGCWVPPGPPLGGCGLCDRDPLQLLPRVFLPNSSLSSPLWRSILVLSVSIQVIAFRLSSVPDPLYPQIFFWSVLTGVFKLRFLFFSLFLANSSSRLPLFCRSRPPPPPFFG